MRSVRDLTRARPVLVITSTLAICALAVAVLADVMRDGPTPPRGRSSSGTTSTTTTPTATSGAPSSTTPANAPPPAAGYFTMLPPGSPLPSGAECAARVHRSPWEPRPENITANHTTPPASIDLGAFSQWNAAWNADYRARIDGSFTGTTDEIAQWA